MPTCCLNGDGRQASHGKDDSLLGLTTALGVMDPTVGPASSGQPTLAIAAADLIAFGVMGYNVAPEPEPESWTLMLAGAGTLDAAIRCRRQTALA